TRLEGKLLSAATRGSHSSSATKDYRNLVLRDQWREGFSTRPERAIVCDLGASGQRMSVPAKGEVHREPRVLIAGNDSATWMGIRLGLAQAGMDVCGHVHATGELVEEVGRLEPDVCLVDVDLAGGGGIRSAAEVATRTPGAAVILLTAEIGEEDFLDALRV